MVGIDMLPLLATEAKERQLSGLKKGNQSPVTANLQERENEPKGEAAQQAAALKYAIKCQRNRRNLTQAEIMKCVQEVDKLKTAGRPAKNKLASHEANYGKSAAEVVV